MSKLTCHYPLNHCTFLSSGICHCQEKQWKPKAEPNLFELCWGASCFAHSEKPRLFEPEKQETPSQSPRGEKMEKTPSVPLFRGKGDEGWWMRGEWFFSEAGFCFLKVWISVRIGSDGGRQMVEVYFRPAAWRQQNRSTTCLNFQKGFLWFLFIIRVIREICVQN